jgi:hypothetical protein
LFQIWATASKSANKTLRHRIDKSNARCALCGVIINPQSGVLKFHKIDSKRGNGLGLHVGVTSGMQRQGPQRDVSVSRLLAISCSASMPCPDFTATSLMSA